MPNEQYLRVSYFVVAALSLVLGYTVGRLLGKPFREVTNATGRGPFAAVLNRSLPLGAVVFALASCLSVSYTARGCGDQRSYEAVVADRSWMVEKNLEQVSETFEGLSIAVLAWGALTLMLFVRPKARLEPKPQNAERPPEGTK